MSPKFCSPGQVQTKKCIEEVLHFAYEENLLVMADEVTSNACRHRFKLLTPHCKFTLCTSEAGCLFLKVNSAEIKPKEPVLIN